jgi:hypothetical protein
MSGVTWAWIYWHLDFQFSDHGSGVSWFTCHRLHTAWSHTDVPNINMSSHYPHSCNFLWVLRHLHKYWTIQAPKWLPAAVGRLVRSESSWTTVKAALLTSFWVYNWPGMPALTALEMSPVTNTLSKAVSASKKMKRVILLLFWMQAQRFPSLCNSVTFLQALLILCDEFNTSNCKYVLLSSVFSNTLSREFTKQTGLLLSYKWRWLSGFGTEGK